MADSIGEFKTKSKESIEHFQREVGKLRSGRANPSILEDLKVDYYGSSVPLKQLGLIGAPEARLLTVQVYDSGAVASVEKAIMQSELGLNPSRDGNLIRLQIPVLTEERRKDLVKTVHKIAEDSRVGVRNHRRDAIDQLKRSEKDKEISEDELHRYVDEIQKLTDQYIKEIDRHVGEKEQELLEV